MIEEELSEIEKFQDVVNLVISEYKVENYKMIFNTRQGDMNFVALYRKETNSLVKGLINHFIKFAVFSENGKIKIEIDGENTMYQH